VTFRRRLKDIKEKEGITIYRLAKNIGVNEATVRGWLTGRTEPRGKNLTKLAAHFKVHPAWLQFGTKEHAPTLHDDIMELAVKLEDYVAGNPGELERIKGMVDVMTGETFRSKDTAVQKKGKKKRRQSAA
jgi:transcriptional regulator with XRE-family HTH domain